MQHTAKLLLAPTLSLAACWSTRVADFTAEWQQRQAQAHSEPPLAFWAEAASAALSGVEQGCQRALDILADLYHVCQQLPAPGDVLMLDALQLKIDQRYFATHRIDGVLHVEVRYYLGIEKYRYTDTMLPLLADN